MTNAEGRANWERVVARAKNDKPLMMIANAIRVSGRRASLLQAFGDRVEKLNIGLPNGGLQSLLIIAVLS